jgi:polynucleotide 5'-kinase involved in rRNA processing
MLPQVVCASRPLRKVQDVGAKAIIYNTLGLVGPAMGTNYLKMTKINLLKPSVVFAVQREDELKRLSFL